MKFSSTLIAKKIDRSTQFGAQVLLPAYRTYQKNDHFKNMIHTVYHLIPATTGHLIWCVHHDVNKSSGLACSPWKLLPKINQRSWMANVKKHEKLKPGRFNFISTFPKYKNVCECLVGVHTNDFAPIHGRRARIHRSPAENYTSTFDSTYSFPLAICEYVRGNRETGQNR